MRIKWSGDIENRRIMLRQEGLSYQKVADILTSEFNIKITKDMVSSRDRIVRLKNSKDDIQTENLFSDELYNLKDSYIASEEIKKQLKSLWEKFQDGKPKKILSLSDLHAPYIDFKKLEIAIKDNLDCNICVLNGDILDGESMSTFDDKLEEIDVKDEFKQVFQLLDVISNVFEHVIWVWGNHDGGRFKKYIMKNIKPSLRKYAYDRLNPIKYISEKYDNVISVNHNLFQIGDVVFKHPNGYSSVEMKTVVNELDVLMANRFDLPNPNFRCVCIGHTHDIFSGIKNGVLLIEQGCLTYVPDYRFNNPVKRRWTTGYARIEIDKEGKVIFNKSKWVCLD